MAIGIAREPIEFESVDGQPVKILFLLVSPADQTGPHIQALAAISRLMVNEQFRHKLEQADCTDDVHRLLSTPESE